MSRWRVRNGIGSRKSPSRDNSHISGCNCCRMNGRTMQKSHKAEQEGWRWSRRTALASRLTTCLSGKIGRGTLVLGQMAWWGGGTNLTVANPSQELLRRVPVLLRAQTLLVEKSTQNTMRLPLVIITSISQDPLSLHHIEVSPTPPMPRCAS